MNNREKRTKVDELIHDFPDLDSQLIHDFFIQSGENYHLTKQFLSQMKPSTKTNDYHIDTSMPKVEMVAEKAKPDKKDVLVLIFPDDDFRKQILNECTFDTYNDSILYIYLFENDSECQTFKRLYKINEKICALLLDSVNLRVKRKFKGIFFDEIRMELEDYLISKQHHNIEELKENSDKELHKQIRESLLDTKDKGNMVKVKVRLRNSKSVVFEVGENERLIKLKHEISKVSGDDIDSIKIFRSSNSSDCLSDETQLIKNLNIKNTFLVVKTE